MLRRSMLPLHPMHTGEQGELSPWWLGVVWNVHRSIQLNVDFTDSLSQEQMYYLHHTDELEGRVEELFSNPFPSSPL